MLDGPAVYQGVLLLEEFDHLGIGLEHMHALHLGKVRSKLSLIVNRAENLKVVCKAHYVVIVAVAGRGVYNACTLLKRNVCAEYNF